MAQTMTGPRVFGTVGELFDSLSNHEMATVLDGGSTRRMVRLATALSSDGTPAEWVPAWVDLDGLWLDDPSDPGYVTPRDWQVDLPY